MKREYKILSIVGIMALIGYFLYKNKKKSGNSTGLNDLIAGSGSSVDNINTTPGTSITNNPDTATQYISSNGSSGSIIPNGYHPPISTLSCYPNCRYDSNWNIITIIPNTSTTTTPKPKPKAAPTKTPPRYYQQVLSPFLNGLFDSNPLQSWHPIGAGSSGGNTATGSYKSAIGTERYFFSNLK